MTQMLLVGTDLPLLEGLAQTFGALGFVPCVAQSLHDARDIAVLHPPLLAVVSRTLASGASTEMLGIPLAAGGALVLYRSAGEEQVTLPPALQRAVLADLSLPLERNRLVALVQHVRERVKETGRTSDELRAEQRGVSEGA
jgi:hypothetical protein